MTLQALVIVAAVWDLGEHGRGRGIAAVVGIGAILMSVLDLSARIRHLPVAASMSVALLAGLIVWRAYAGAMRPNRPVGDRIVGAVCVYLLIGLAWAKVYETLDTVAPGSFRFPAGTAWATLGMPRYTYLSFITLATVGYGDVTPGHAPGRHPRLDRGDHRPAIPRHHGRPAGGAVAGRGSGPRSRPSELTPPAFARSPWR